MTSSRSSTSAIEAPRARALFAAIVALAALAVPAQAEARKRIVVLGVDGPGGDRIAHQLNLLVQRRHATVTAERFSRDLAAREHTDANIARVARDLAVDGVVIGEIAERDDSYRLTVRLREGRTGAFVQTIAVRLESPELTRAAARQIWRMLMPAIEGLPPVATVELEDGGDPAPDTPARPPDDLDVGAAGDEGESASRARPDDDADDADEAQAHAHRPGGGSEHVPAPGEDGARPAIAETRSLPALEIYGGLSVTTRSMSFSHDPNLDNPPQDYAGAVAPGARVSAELYPLAFSRDDGLSRLGITAMIDHALSIDSEVTHEGTTTSLPTSQSRAGAGVVYRHPFGEGGDGLVLKGSLRLSTLSFKIDRDPAPIDIDVPSVTYRYVDPGVHGRYPFGDVALYAEARGMLVMSTGEIQRAEQYGTASLLGLDVDVGVEYAFADALAVRGGFRFTGISHDFEGDGARTDRGGPSDVDVAGAHDRYLGGYLTAGYTF